MGSHPDIVTRVWDVLGAALPADSRAIVFGTPSLVHPHSGVVLAMSFGTSYLLHLPQAIAAEAIARGCKTREGRMAPQPSWRRRSAPAGSSAAGSTKR